MTQAGALDNVLRAIEHATLALDTVLVEEQAVLANAKSDSLESIIERKHAALQNLEMLETSRRQWFEAQGLPGDAAHVKRNLAALNDNFQRETDRWESITARIERCEQRNRVNGALLAMRRKFAADTLALLGGRQTDTVYTASGSLQRDAINAATIPA